MKKFFVIAILILCSTYAFAQQDLVPAVNTIPKLSKYPQLDPDPKKWDVWNYITDGLPTEVEFGDIDITTAFSEIPLVSRDANGNVMTPAIFNPFEPIFISAWVINDKGRISKVSGQLTNAPTTYAEWETMFVFKQQGALEPVGSKGYTVHLSKPIEYRCIRKCNQQNGHLVRTYEFQIL